MTCQATPSSPERQRGASVKANGIFFRVWAPAAKRVEVLIEQAQRLPLEPLGDGYFEVFAPGVQPLATYQYLLDDGPPLPDPASRYQPEGVHGPSQVIDPRTYTWRDQMWPGVSQKDLVFYEVHIGTFTREGTFRAAARKLTYLRELGVTAIELMPLAECAGRWNWGYDSAALYAPYHHYGTPDDLRTLVNAAHQQGLAVFLDVVYNHFGPDGSYATAFANFFTEKHCSPWGRGINLDDCQSEGVRSFFIDNALYWLTEYHFDGLRLDATHALQDDSQLHFLAELSAAVEALPGRKRYLIAEDERNLAPLVRPRAAGGYGLDAVWADDFHHQIRNLTAGDAEGYFADFVGTTAAQIATTLKQGWFYTGQRSEHQGVPRGTETSGLGLERFVICIQNHDQVGNRPQGDRLHHHIPLPLYRAVSALLLFGPELPLLFMGQEWAASAPFLFFTDHHDELGVQITEGRRREFEGFAGFQSDVPDPQDPATFERNKLDWDERDVAAHAGILQLYRDLLHLRPSLAPQTEIVVHGDRSLSVTRGRHHLFVTLADGERLPFPVETESILSTEDRQYTPDGQPPRREGEWLVFPRAGALLGRTEI